VFFEKKYIGGVEEIHKLHDNKKLEKLLDCCERIDDKVITKKMIIVRLVGECGFQRCSHCNENDLIRCFICCF